VEQRGLGEGQQVDRDHDRGQPGGVDRKGSEGSRSRPGSRPVRMATD
jgi:hypothetical protein